MPIGAGQTVGVVIPTFRRPDRLQRALENLADTASHAPVGWRMGVIVVDDDSEGSAAPVVQAFAATFELGCTYVRSGAGNISDARNLGLETGTADGVGPSGGFAWLASLDDDVIVPRKWFAVCADAAAKGTHNAVTGPLLKDFGIGPHWLTSEPFDQLGILAGTDGEDAFVCATGNNWIDASFLRERPNLRFDPTLGRTGGEDMDFFYRAVADGLRPVFRRDAAVTEPEPASRCTFRYQVRRAFWLGVMEARVSLRLALASRPRLLARSARRLANGGAAQLPPEARSRRRTRFHVAVAAQCLGVFAGCAGVSLRHR